MKYLQILCRSRFLLEKKSLKGNCWCRIVFIIIWTTYIFLSFSLSLFPSGGSRRGKTKKKVCLPDFGPNSLSLRAPCFPQHSCLNSHRCNFLWHCSGNTVQPGQLKLKKDQKQQLKLNSHIKTYVEMNLSSAASEIKLATSLLQNMQKTVCQQTQYV